MATAAARYASAQNHKSFILMNRNLNKAFHLKERLNLLQTTKVLPLDQLESSLKDVSMIIIATASPSYILDFYQVKNHVLRHPQKSLCIVDLALPRNIDPLCHNLDNVFLFKDSL